MKSIGSVLFFLTILFSQARIGDWKSYTSPLIIQDIVEMNGQIICATEGGLLIFDISAQEFATLTNIDGLSSINLGTVNIDSYGHVWLGGAEPKGFVQIYDVNGERSVEEFNYNLTEIIDFTIGDSIAFGIFIQNQDFGIAKYLHDGVGWAHNDLMYSDWLFESNNISDIEIWNDTVFVGTDKGLYAGNLNDDPHNWTQVFPEELAGDISSVKLFEDELLVIKENKPYRINLTEWVVSSSLSNISLLELVKSTNGQLWGIRSNKRALINLDSGWEINTDYNLSQLIPLPDGSLVVGTESGISVYYPETQKLNRYIPNALLSNQLTAITVLDDGRIVVAGSIIDPDGKSIGLGLAIKEKTGWRNIIETTSNDTIVSAYFDYSRFAADTIPVDFGAYVADLEQGPNGLLYCAIRGTYPEPRRHGGGIIILDVDNPADFTIIDTTFLDYIADEYMVVKELEFDGDGNLWIADPYAKTKHTSVHVQNTEGIWKSYSADDGMAEGILGLTPNTFVFDAWNRVWIGSFQDSPINGSYPDGGLVMLNYMGDPANPTAYEWTDIDKYHVDVGIGGTNKTIWSLGITPDNRIYALTPVGLTYFDLSSSDEDPVLQQGPRSPSGELYAYFPNIPYGGPDPNAKLKIDSRGNVWTISKSDGIHVLLNNATYWPDIEGFRESNSPLLSDAVTDIDFDHERGLAYITTNKGLNSLKIPFAKSKSGFNKLKIFPSPFHIPSDRPLIVDGLKDGSSLKIMTVTGEVLRDIFHGDLKEHGYQITWDGQDKHGNWVASGVYLLSVYDPEGVSAFGKITVIRH